MSAPSVLFICVKNGGKSQMAAALMRQLAGPDIEVHSAGTRPGTALNELSVQVLDEVGASTVGEAPKLVDADLLARMDVVVTLGEEAQVDHVSGPRFETWVTDEPSERGIDGIERMRLVRDDIAARVSRLKDDLSQGPSRSRPPQQYRVSASATAQGNAVVEAAGASIDIDATWGGAPDGPGPAELLAAALAACMLKNLSRCGDLLGFQYDRAEVDVVARRQDSPPKFVEFTYALRVSTDEPEHRVNLAHTNLRKFGTVFNTLAAVCEVNGTLEAFPRVDHD